MSNVLKALMSGGVAPLYVDDVFSSFLYTGNGSTQTITNGIDLAGKGGLVWVKNRTTADGHALYDTVRGVNNKLATETIGAQSASGGVTAFSSSGFSIDSLVNVNRNTNSIVSWTFRKAAKFFDCGTYNGTASNQTINHALGGVPGMVIVKRTDTTGNWAVWHRGLSAGNWLKLNLTDAQASQTTIFPSDPTSTQFTVGTNTSVNTTGGTYTWYAFAHDTAADGIVQCGSFTTDAGGLATVNLGYEPQFLLFKNSTGTAASWNILDVSRGWPVTGNLARLQVENLNAEGSITATMTVNATGFSNSGVGSIVAASTTYIYLAIRRPNKPPTTGTQVYNAIARTGTGAAATVTGVGFAPDLVLPFNRPQTYAYGASFYDRLRGTDKQLIANSIVAESTSSSALTGFDVMDGIKVGTDVNGVINLATTYINHFFRRAPGVFDVVCSTAVSSAFSSQHNLGVTPELVILKPRSEADSWYVYHTGLDCRLQLQSNIAAVMNDTMWTVTSSTVALAAGFLGTSPTLVAYLFATKAGISFVGSYTGNGTTQNIEMGFSAGARFFLVKATSTTGNWVVFDTVRGIIAGSDPYLLLNSTAAEDIDEDAVDPYAGGITVNETSASSINTNAVTYIFLALA